MWRHLLRRCTRHSDSELVSCIENRTRNRFDCKYHERQSNKKPQTQLCYSSSYTPVPRPLDILDLNIRRRHQLLSVPLILNISRDILLWNMPLYDVRFFRFINTFKKKGIMESQAKWPHSSLIFKIVKNWKIEMKLQTSSISHVVRHSAVAAQDKNSV